MEVKNSDRMVYYAPFIDSMNNLEIYTIKDSTSFMLVGKKFNHFPRIFVENRKNDSVYLIDCFEDVAWQIDNLNKSDFSYLETVDKKLDTLKGLMNQNSKLVFKKENKQELDVNKWNVYMVYATFLGKKLRKRTFSITDLEGLNDVKILDFSIDKIDPTL